MATTESELKKRITEDMKSAMKSGDKGRLGVIRLILSALKQKEVDERIVLDESQILVILDKMIKQRRDSAEQYKAAGRDDLYQQESFEIEVIQHYLPEALDPNAVQQIIAEALQTTGATTIKDLGKVMAIIKPKVQGRADLSEVSAQVKQHLGS